jgi:hypothetical protein
MAEHWDKQQVERLVLWTAVKKVVLLVVSKVEMRGK